jgi:hypothetical protein
MDRSQKLGSVFLSVALLYLALFWLGSAASQAVPPYDGPGWLAAARVGTFLLTGAMTALTFGPYLCNVFQR